MKRVPVILLGSGGVGQALLKQLVDGRTRISDRSTCRFDVIAIVDSRSYVWQEKGLSDEELHDVIALKGQGLPLSGLQTAESKNSGHPHVPEILERVSAAGIKKAIIVDVTASDGMESIVDHALNLGYGVAMANKKALAGPWARAHKYYNHPLIRHESTVGGGQPVIATLRYLLDVNDPIYQITGQLSGTLGYICSSLDKGMSFSQAVAVARARGFTEPDPREDLGGKDVMRKVMILGRMAGWPLEEEDISVESLYAPELADLSVEMFMFRCAELDECMRQRVAEAASRGEVLRYTAEVSKDGGTVGLQSLPADSPLANLKYISFRTERYDDEPLLIGGKGAGVEMTAAGVLGDMISLVREACD